MSDPQSQFKVYSYGIVADNKAISSRTINVSPIEINSMADGELTSNPTDVQSKGVDGDGQNYNVSIKTDNVIEALWLPWGSNRVTPPDVRRGEPVLIWQYGSTDKYYWTALGLKDDLRRLETVVYAFNGNPNNGSKEFNPEDFYFVEVSSHTKQITLKTSNKNGEPFRYLFQFNLDKGQVILADDAKNSFFLDSKNVQMKMELNTGTKVELDKLDLLLQGIKQTVIKGGSSTMTMNDSGTTLKTPKFTGGR